MPKQTISNLYSDVKLAYLKKYLKGTSILDLGAGQCHYTKWISQQWPKYSIVAIDQLNIPKQTTFNYVKHNLEKPLPFESNTFSTIIAFDIIEHISNENNLLQELQRISIENGILIGSVPHDDDGFLPQYNLTFYHRTDLTHKRYYTTDTLKKTLENNGFSVLLINLEGTVPAQVFAEFFNKNLHFIIKKIIGILRRLHIISTKKLASDIFFVAQK
jgi:ubiquinone/menaquinone biosynthesis C-methylase UbiE